VGGFGRERPGLKGRRKAGKMKAKNDERKTLLSSLMVDDGATERLKKRLKDLGLIVNAGAGG